MAALATMFICTLESFICGRVAETVTRMPFSPGKETFCTACGNIVCGILGALPG